MNTSVLSLNRRLSRSLGASFSHVHAGSDSPLDDAYFQAVAAEMNARTAPLVVDVGGGRRCLYAHLRTGNARIVAVDISAEELAHNTEADETRVANCCERIPFDDGSVDVISSRFLLEHLSDVRGFFREANRVLKSGGVLITLYPNKNAPFSILNRIMPFWLSRKVLYAARGARNLFPAFYRECSPRQVGKALADSGLSPVFRRVSFSQSHYFDFLAPLYFLVCCYESLVKHLHLDNLCAYELVIARKP